VVLTANTLAGKFISEHHASNPLLLLLLLPGKGWNSINECLCPVIKNFASHRYWIKEKTK
jgi:hypothetical protein